MKIKNDQGHISLAILLIVLVIAIGGVGYMVWNRSQESKNSDKKSTSSNSKNPSVDTIKYTIDIPEGAVSNQETGDNIAASRLPGTVYRHYTLDGQGVIIGIEVRPFTEQETQMARDDEGYGLAATNAASEKAMDIFKDGDSRSAARRNVDGAKGEGYMVLRVFEKAIVTVLSAATKDNHMVTVEIMGATENFDFSEGAKSILSEAAQKDFDNYAQVGKSVIESLKLK